MAYLDEEECPCCLTHSCHGFRRFIEELKEYLGDPEDYLEDEVERDPWAR